MKFNLKEATSSVQTMINGFIERLPYLALALVVLFIFFFVAKAVRGAVRAVATRHKRHYNLGVVMGRLAHGAIILLGLLIALVIAIPSFTPAKLINVLGLSSVAIGFAFRDILQNFFAGILLLLTEPFRIGDQIIVNGFEGTVEEIQARATYIQTYDGRRVVIPNSNLFTNSVTVNTANEKRRLQYDVGIGYGDDVDRACSLILEAVREVENTLDDPAPEALVVDLAGSSLNIRVRWWINPPRRADVVASTHAVLRAVRNDAPVIVTLATLGVVLACAVTAAGLHYLVGWPWMAAVLLGLLISATDPVSVIATFKEAGVTGRLRLLVESESLANDGTVAVLYGVALVVATGGDFSVPGAVGSFFVTVVGGVLCGALVCGAVLLFAGRTEDHLVEITFSTVAAYGSFLLAEHFHLSGVLATMTAGVMIGNLGSLGAFSDRGREAAKSFWEYAGFVANSLIFLLIGIKLVLQNVTSVLAVASLVVGLVILGRAVAVYGCCLFFQGSRWRVSARQQHVLFWGGLRGALALALALGLPGNLPQRETIISVSFIVVAFSVIVQGLTMTPLLRRVGELGPPAGPEVAS